MSDTPTGAWQCKRCQGSEPRLDFNPWPGELGERLLQDICGNCWKEWMGVQTKIINEYRINVLHPEHKAAVQQQCEIFFGYREAPDQQG